MKKNILFFIMICYSVIATGQSIQSLEYYIDVDPGFGNGTALVPPFTDTYAFDADVTTLTNGLHTLYIRAKDTNGHWGFSEQHQFVKIENTVFLTNQLLELEYYFNQDPGFGNGTTISLTPTDTVVAFHPDVSNLPAGLHNLYVRAKDNEGNWGFSEKHSFMKIETSDFVTNQLTMVEYYLDQDPGFGNGVAIPLTPNDTVVAFSPDLSNVSVGLHHLYIRAKDSKGNWGFSEKHSFVKLSAALPPTIEYLEYYVDTDPGEGNGISLAIPLGQTVIEGPFVLDMKSLSIGTHTLYVRAKDTNNQWSFVAQHVFNKTGVVAADSCGIFWQNTVNITTSPNTIQKSTNDNSWSAGGNSSDTLALMSEGLISMEALETNTTRAFGLASPNTNVDISSIDYAICLKDNATIEIQENGTSKGTFGNYQTGDIFQVALTDSIISYWKNDSIFYTSMSFSTTDLVADFSIFTQGGTIYKTSKSFNCAALPPCTNDTTYLTNATCNPLDTGLVLQQLLNIGGCDSLVYTTTVFYPDPIINSISSTNPTAAGVADGGITITATGATALEYSVDCGQTWHPTGVFTGLANGTYHITVRNVGGCGTLPCADTVNLYNPNSIVVSNVVPVNPMTCGVDDGSITVIATGQGTLEYSINGGISYQASNQFLGLGVGTYDVITRYVGGCCSVSSGLFTLVQTGLPIIDSVSYNNPNNCTNSNGDITIFATSASTIEYSIDNGQTWQSTNSFTGLSNGSYGIAVKNVMDTCVVFGTPVQLIPSSIMPSFDTLYATTCDTNLVGMTTQTFTNQYGCDSTITTITSLLPSNFDTLYATTCDINLVGMTTQTLTNQYGCDSTITTITSLLPSLNLGITADTMICVGEMIQLNATGGTTYSWSPTTGLTNPLIANPIATPIVSTTYVVSVSMTNHCPTMDSVSITVVPNPVIEAFGDTSICIGESASLDATGGVVYYWMDSTSLNAGNIPNPIATPTTTSTYVVMGIDNNGCQSTDSVSVEVFQTQTPMITAIADTLTAGNFTPPVTFQWFLDGMPIDGATNATHIAAVSGSFTVEVTDLNGCVATSTPYQHIHTGLKNLESIDFMIRPNPAQDYVVVQFTMPLSGTFDLKVRDIVGRVVYEEKHSRYYGVYKKQFNTSRFIDGLYIVELMINGRLYTKKLIVTH